MFGLFQLGFYKTQPYLFYFCFESYQINPLCFGLDQMLGSKFGLVQFSLKNPKSDLAYLSSILAFKVDQIVNKKINDIHKGGKRINFNVEIQFIED